MSLRLRNLIIRLIEGFELGWEQLQRELDQIKTDERIRQAYCIRLEENLSRRESEVIFRQTQENLQRGERQKMLQSVHLNLVPSRIELLSKRP